METDAVPAMKSDDVKRRGELDATLGINVG